MESKTPMTVPTCQIVTNVSVWEVQTLMEKPSFSLCSTLMFVFIFMLIFLSLPPVNNNTNNSLREESKKGKSPYR